jgi:hypothetical protein
MPLKIGTPDGSGQAVHPDVVYIPGGILSYEYWMACTPYPFGSDRLENPILRVSNDGINWGPLPGAPDPLVPAPDNPHWHHADTDLVIHNGVLHLFFMSTNRHKPETILSLMKTRDGVHWTSPTAIYRGDCAVSPAAVVDEDGHWRLWYVWRDSLSSSQWSKLYLHVTDDPKKLGAPQICSLTIPGYVVWHLDVSRFGGGYEALVTAFPIGRDPSRSLLFHASSVDGIEFTPSTGNPLLKPSWVGWDNRMIYRSTFIKGQDGAYRVWYSAASWGMRCGIGLLEGTLTNLRSPCDRDHPLFFRLLTEDLFGLVKYALRRVLPGKLYASILSARNRMRTLLSGRLPAGKT